MAKVQGAVAKLRPKISPVLEHLSCVQSCLSSQESCDTNTNNKAKKNSKTNKKTVHELNSGDSALTWCRLAYWEERTRVGAQVSGTKRALEVFSSQPRPSASHDAVSLETLHSLNPKPSQATLRTREKIGLGLILSRDESGVWVHNRSQVPLFVNSPTLDVPNSRTFSVFKIPPGFSMQVFSWGLARLYSTIRDPAAYDGPFDPHSLRLSFAKGWGGSYARQYVECCPCWLEIMLTPPR